MDGQTRLSTGVLDEAGTAVYASGSLAPGVHYISAYFPGTANSAASVSSVLVESIPSDVPDFAIGLSTSEVRLSETPISVPLSIDSVNGFSQSVTLACSTGTPDLRCDIEPAIAYGGSGTSTLTLAIRSVTSAAQRGFPIMRVLATLIAVPFLVVLFPSRRSCSRVLFFSIALCTVCLGCGSPVSKKPAPAQAYPVTVSGSSQQGSGEVVHGVVLQAQILSE